MRGIGPRSAALETAVLPLNYTRWIVITATQLSCACRAMALCNSHFGGSPGIRTQTLTH